MAKNKNELTPELVEKIRYNYVELNKSPAMFAKEIGLGSETVYACLHQLGVKLKRKVNVFSSGQRFGRLTTIQEVDNPKNKHNKRHRWWLCVCDCGEERIFQADAVRNGTAVSCGCSKKITARKNAGIVVDREIDINDDFLQNLTGSIFTKTKINAKRRKIQFHLTREDVYDMAEYQEEKCALTGQKLDSDNVSIDRADSNKPYTFWNTRLITKRVNFIKLTLTEGQLWDVCKIVIDKNLNIEMPQLFKGITYGDSSVIEKDDLYRDYVELKIPLNVLAKKYKHRINNIVDYLNFYKITSFDIDETDRVDYCSISPRRYSFLKASAKSRGIDIDVSPKYLFELFLKQDQKCAISNMEIFLDTSASLDRIDSSLGYIQGNVQWVHSTINVMKNNISDKEFIEQLTLISNHRKKDLEYIPF